MEDVALDHDAPGGGEADESPTQHEEPKIHLEENQEGEDLKAVPKVQSLETPTEKGYLLLYIFNF